MLKNAEVLDDADPVVIEPVSVVSGPSPRCPQVLGKRWNEGERTDPVMAVREAPPPTVKPVDPVLARHQEEAAAHSVASKQRVLFITGCPNCWMNELRPEKGGKTVQCADCHHRWQLLKKDAEPVGWKFVGLGEDYNAVRVAAKFARMRAAVAGLIP